MFTRLSAVIVLAFPVFASALTIQPFSQCDTGELQCCDTVDSVSNITFRLFSVANLSRLYRPVTPSLPPSLVSWESTSVILQLKSVVCLMMFGT